MNNRRVLSTSGSASFLLLLLSSAFPSPAQAAWVSADGSQFTVGGNLITTAPFQITPTAAAPLIAPTCGTLGGTSLALVPGSKMVPEVPYRVVLVVSCLDNNATVHRRLNFIDPATGVVIKQVSTNTSSSKGWDHFLYRPDKGDLLGCADNGDLYSIALTVDPVTLMLTATPQTRPSGLSTCAGLAWDAEADIIYQGIDLSGNKRVGRVVRFKDKTTILLGDFTNLPCAGNGLTISGGVLLMSCQGELRLFRLNKDTGATLGVHGTLIATGLPVLSSDPGLGDLACDPVTFQKVGGRDMFRDAMWSRRGANGNGVVALEFPAFTCGLPSKSVVPQLPLTGVPFSPLAAGLSTGTAASPGEFPLRGCFDGSGVVIDADGDGLPDCWEGTGAGIDFNGDGTLDLALCVRVDTNGDGIPETTPECADPTRKDLFVEIDWMQHHKPDPKALSQTQSVASVGVKSVREAFAAAPVSNPSTAFPTGIAIHFQVDEEVRFIPQGGGAETSHVTLVAFTPCTPSASTATNLNDAVDFDVVKAANFGTSAERLSDNTRNAKRLAFRYVLFAHNVMGSGGGGSSGSGCAEVGGDDAVVTLGSFAGTVAGHTGGVGTTDQQAGTFMHELGHTLGLRHGGADGINCKPNYRSVMSYTRQFAGSPIPLRRLDYSRSSDIPLIEASLNESQGLGSDLSLGPISQGDIAVFPSDQIAYGPNAWSLVTTAAGAPINWNRNTQGRLPKIDSGDLTTAFNINAGATAGCTGDGITTLAGHNDWGNLLYRTSAAIDFAGGGRSETPHPVVEMTSEEEQAFASAQDADGNGAGDGTDCGGVIDAKGIPSFYCTHRIDIKPSYPFPKTIDPGTEAVITIAIFSEVNGSQVWNAPAQVIRDVSLTLSVESIQAPVKVNSKGQGTCSVSDVADPVTLKKDGIKDVKCQFPTSGLPSGTHYGVVSGKFLDSLTGETRAFSARQLVTIVE